MFHYSALSIDFRITTQNVLRDGLFAVLGRSPGTPYSHLVSLIAELFVPSHLALVLAYYLFFLVSP